jgi:outer membrane receptor for ferrienterochelin and colicin
MRDGNSKKISGKGGISLISSRFTIEAPIVKDKGSIILSGRRTYADLMYKAIKPDTKGTALYFYDFNGKANYSINENNKVFISSYSGRDIFRVKTADASPGVDWGNVTTTLRWNHIYNSRLFSNTSLIHSKYDYQLGFGSQGFTFNWESRLVDYAFKTDFDYYLNEKNALSFGVSSTLHKINPGLVSLTSDQESGELNIPRNQTLEHGIYLGNEQKITSKLTLNYGLRFTLMQNMGKTTVFNFDENYNLKDSVNYKKGEIYHSYAGLEPRINGNYLIDSKQSIKFGYSRTRQFLHLASNSISGTPLDIWIPSSSNVKPQIADMVTVGYFRNFLNNKIEVSTEVYYKYMQNQIDFKDHANLFLNDKLEGEIRFGTANAKGVELKVAKPSGRLNGWVSYTLSRSERVFKDIANGNPYLSPFDRTHNISTVANYQITKRLSLSGNWTFFSGLPFTSPSGRFVYGNEVVPTYTQRNGDRLPNYHRMDLGVTLDQKKNANRKFHSSWNFSVYNAYNRKNANMIRFTSDPKDPFKTRATKTSIFPIIPTATWNFEF